MRLTLLQDLRRLPRPVYILIIGQFLNRFGAFVFPFLALILDQRGYSKGEITLVLGALAVGHIAGPLVGGYLADAIGRRNTIVLSLLGSAVTLLGIYAAPTFTALALCALLNGFFNFLFGPAAHALITDLTPPALRLTSFALFRFAINAGFAAGPAVAGFLFTRAPALLFFGDALSTVIFAAFAWIWLPHGLRSIAGRASSPRVVLRSWLDACASLRAHHAYRQYLGVLLLTGICFVQIFSLLSLTTRDRGLEPTVYGALMGLNGLLVALIELPLSAWYQRFPPRRLLAIGNVLMAVGAALFGLAGGIQVFVLAMVVFTLGEIVALPTGLTYSSDLAPEAARGRFFGFRGVTWGFASLFGSAGVWVYGEIGVTWWLIAATLPLFAAIGILPKPAVGRMAQGCR
jgi:MFS family permease